MIVLLDHNKTINSPPIICCGQVTLNHMLGFESDA